MPPRPDLGPRPALAFAGSRIERAAELRVDATALAARMRDPESRCYVIGGAFWLLGMAMPIKLTLAPLGFGLLWFASLVMVGMHLRRLGRAAAAARADAEGEVATVLYKGQK